MEIVRGLTAHVGGTTRYWLVEVTEQHALAVYRSHGHEMRRQAEAQARAAREIPDPESPVIVELNRYMTIRETYMTEYRKRREHADAGS